MVEKEKTEKIQAAITIIVILCVFFYKLMSFEKNSKEINFTIFVLFISTKSNTSHLQRNSTQLNTLNSKGK